MILFENALNLVLNSLKIMGIENISIINSLKRIAVEDIYSSIDIPPFDISLMDGYAVRCSDTNNASINNPKILRIIEELSAGNITFRSIRKGEAIRIMTGVKIPGGCEAVIKLEDTLRYNNRIKVFKKIETNENIKKAGSDIKKREIIISKGNRIIPEDIALLASIKRLHIKVYQIPRISIISTGNELVDIDNKVEDGKLINSNSYLLASKVIECGAIPVIAGIVRDEKGELKRIITMNLLNSDIIISTGGTGKGDYDIIMDELKSMGADIIFSDVAIRPGRSVIFSLINEKPFFGLPGSPGSAMIDFEEFVRPSILKIMGCNKIFRPVVYARVKRDIKSDIGIRSFITASLNWDIDNFYVEPIKKGFNGIMIIPEGRTYIEPNESLKVQILYMDKI